MSIKEQIPINKKSWFAVKCKYRCEQRLSVDLEKKGIVSYVPIQKKVRQYASRKKTSESALIPSHVFVYIDQSEYLDVLKHTYVFSFLNFSGQLCAIPQEEIDVMKRVVGEYEDIIIDNAYYNIGDEVQIIGGELTGLTGFLVAYTNQNFKLSLSSMGIGLNIYVEPQHMMKMRSAKKVA